MSIDAQGDSTMHGTEQLPDGSYIIASNSAPADLQALLQATYGATVTVTNNGLGGSTVADRLQASGGYSQWWKDYVATDSAQIVIENWGINDSNPIVNETPAQFEADLLAWVQLTQQAGKIVVLEEPQPVCNPSFSALPQYVQVVDNVAAQLGLPLVQQYQYIESLPNWQSYLGADCTHPADDRLYQIKAQREYAVLAPIVQSLRAGI
ncbi:hypothetical protein A6456_10485 [Paraburkholderia tropica]|nr:hypothetical protein A6456_10485 [Paraburkholderia tropica]